MKTFTSEQLADEIAALIIQNSERLHASLITWEWFSAKQNAFYSVVDKLGIGDLVGCRLSRHTYRDTDVRDPGLEAELIEAEETAGDSFLGWRAEHSGDDPEHN